MKDVRITKIVKKMKFDGVLGELEAQTRFQRQSFTRYLRLNLVFM